MTNIRNSLEHLDPNITKTVHFLRDNGFVTTDSGDGEYKIVNDIDEDALPWPHVYMRCEVDSLREEALRLKKLLEDKGIQVFQMNGDTSQPSIQISWDVCWEEGLIELIGVHDGMFP